MSGAQTCKSCGIPIRTSKSLTWNSNGTITEARNPDHRMVFADVDGLGELFANIEGLIGISIQSIITESKAKATGDFTKELIRGWKGAVVRRAGLGIVINKMGGVAKSFGYGDIDILEVDWKQNKIDFRLHDPYSVPQRMRCASQDYDAWKKYGAPDFRELLATLGFGNMVSFEAVDGTYTATIENAALPLMVVGTALGALEAITGKKATADWSFEHGDLSISVREA